MSDKKSLLQWVLLAFVVIVVCAVTVNALSMEQKVTQVQDQVVMVASKVDQLVMMQEKTPVVPSQVLPSGSPSVVAPTTLTQVPRVSTVATKVSETEFIFNGFQYQIDDQGDEVGPSFLREVSIDGKTVMPLSCPDAACSATDRVRIYGVAANDGRVWVTFLGDGSDNPGIKLYELDVRKKTLVSAAVNAVLPSVSAQHKLSPQGDWMAVVYDNKDMEPERAQQLFVYNLLTNEKKVITNSIAPWTYNRADENTFAGFYAGEQFRWVKDSCFIIGTYLLDQKQQIVNQKQKEYCIEGGQVKEISPQ